MDACVEEADLLSSVKQMQAVNGYTDQQMADKIGCSRVTYQQTRTGRIKVGSTFLSGAMRFLGIRIHDLGHLSAPGPDFSADLARLAGEVHRLAGTPSIHSQREVTHI